MLRINIEKQILKKGKTMAIMSESNLAYTEEVEKNLLTDGFVQFQKDGVNSKILIDQGRYDMIRRQMDNAVVEMVLAGIRDMEEGNLIPADEVFEELRQKYGL